MSLLKRISALFAPKTFHVACEFEGKTYPFTMTGRSAKIAFRDDLSRQLKEQGFIATSFLKIKRVPSPAHN